MNNRELNAKVATDVMGWRWDDAWGCLIPPDQQTKPGDMWSKWKVDDEGVLYREPIKENIVSHLAYIGDFSKVVLPHYSTDISAALPVLEWLRQQYFSIKIIMWDHTDKVAIVGHKRQGHDENIGDLEIEANTLSGAICLAALKAVEDK